MPDWSLRLLGRFRLIGDGEEISSLGRKGEALLAYLALDGGRTHARAKLASLLWSDRGDEQARHSLRQCLLTLRKSLEGAPAPVLSSDGDEISVDRSVLDVDALEFERLVADGSPSALRRAVSLYGGELLEGLDARSDEFEDWLQRERARYRDMMVDALRRLVAEDARQSDHEGVIEKASRLLDLDPLDEAAHRHLMRAYYDSGRRADALRQYQRCEEALSRELQARPERDTTVLFERIRADTGRLPKEARPADGTPRQSRLRFRLPPGLSARPWSSYALSAAVVVATAVAVVWVIVPIVIHIIHREPPRLAVVPFTYAKHSPADEQLANGLTGGVTSALSIVSVMRVIDAGTMIDLKGGQISLPELAHELKVGYFLQGNVNRSADRVRVTATLTDMTDLKGGRILWTEHYEPAKTDVFRIQDEITQKIITALQVKLTEGEQEQISLIHGPQNLRAWLEAGQGLKQLRRLTRRSKLAARAHYQEAIRIDPAYAGAWEGLAWTHFIDARFGWTQSAADSIAKAWEAAQKVLAIDRDSKRERPKTQALLGALSLVKGDHARAVEYGERARMMSPSGADIHALLAVTYTYTGEPERSIKLLREAMELSPFYPDWYRWMLGRAYRMTGRFLDSETELAVGLDTTVSILPKVELVATLMELRRIGAAQAQAERILDQHPRFRVRDWIAVPPYKDQSTAEREARLLRDAGLPE